jgi:hypothetical protein
MSYSEPLCMKCLHIQSVQSVHSDIISYSEDAEIRRCTIGMCLCIVSSKKEEKKDNKDT